MAKEICVTGAREHNLKNISVKIPRNAFTVVTGLSGSGKSSLAFDTIYAEGQRRYVESLSPYARQFLEKMKKPDVDRIQGLSPSISIEQKHTSRNPRSTVGTVSEVYDYMRLLFAKVGDIACYQCGKAVSSLTLEAMCERVFSLPDNARLYVLAPIVRERKGEFKDVLERIRKQGFTKAIIDGVMCELDGTITLSKSKRHHIDVVVDRSLNDSDNQEHIRQSIQSALRLTHGVCIVEYETGKAAKTRKKKQLVFSEHLYCHACGVGYEELSPNLFSFNSSQGACPTCRGVGRVTQLVHEYVIVNEEKPLLRGALNKEIYFSFNKYYIQELVHGLQKCYQFDITLPFSHLPADVQEAFFWGNTELSGIIDILRDVLHKTDSASIKNKLRKFLHEETCAACSGGRLRAEARGVTIEGESIVALSALSIDALQRRIAGLRYTDGRAVLAEPIIMEITTRLDYLLHMGLGYLSLDRSAATLSGGEMQRVRLATQVGTGLTGVLYVLDEPSIGLHARDNDTLLQVFEELKKRNNTVVVVEHDEETMKRADHIVDLGPGAGEGGGSVLFSLPAARVFNGIAKNTKLLKRSLTVQYLHKKKKIAVPETRKKIQKDFAVQINGISEHNLKGIDITIPLGVMVCVTGVSGSGKSTVVHDVLFKALHNKVWKTDYVVGAHERITGLKQVDNVIEIDQAPIGRTPRSNPATYVDVFTAIRKLFSDLPDAKIRGYKQGVFSFNVKGGRCEACEGAGMQRIEMSFLPDVHVVCDVCRGRRYTRETLEVRYKEKSIADVLEMSIAEAREFFDAVPQIRDRLAVLCSVGLGYVRLGQSSTTLSGGEAQRVKIAYELSKKVKGHTVYILDEPTTGLHFADIDNLLGALAQLRDSGNTVIIIEHNMDVIKTADHIIDLGPEGGDKGGKLVASGTPEKVSRSSKSHTGRYLKKHLLRRGSN